MGRIVKPKKYRTVKELQRYIDEYFASTDKPTITGLTLACGYASRQSLIDKERDPRYAATIKKARLRVEASYEAQLREGKNVAGAIFALKNMGWTDREPTDTGQAVINQFVIRLPAKKEVDRIQPPDPKMVKIKAEDVRIVDDLN